VSKRSGGDDSRHHQCPATCTRPRVHFEENDTPLRANGKRNYSCNLTDHSINKFMLAESTPGRFGYIAKWEYVVVWAGVPVPSPVDEGDSRLRCEARLGAAKPRRGGRAVECGGLENRFGPLGPTRVQIPPPPLNQAGLGSRPAAVEWLAVSRTFPVNPGKSIDVFGSPLISVVTGAQLAH
jgi:hypothetical protein